MHFNQNINTEATFHPLKILSNCGPLTQKDLSTYQFPIF